MTGYRMDEYQKKQGFVGTGSILITYCSKCKDGYEYEPLPDNIYGEGQKMKTEKIICDYCGHIVEDGTHEYRVQLPASLGIYDFCNSMCLHTWLKGKIARTLEMSSTFTQWMEDDGRYHTTDYI